MRKDASRLEERCVDRDAAGVLPGCPSYGNWMDLRS